MNFLVQVTLFSGHNFKWCSELLLCVLLEDRQKRKGDYRFYMPYGYSLGLRMSSPGYTDRLCGRLGGEPASPQTPFVAAGAGGVAAAIYWNSCSFYKVLATLQKPSPLYQCSPSTALKILLFLLPSPQLTPGKSPQESY